MRNPARKFVNAFTKHPALGVHFISNSGGVEERAPGVNTIRLNKQMNATSILIRMQKCNIYVYEFFDWKTNILPLIFALPFKNW